jgi:hypothetical protein
MGVQTRSNICRKQTETPCVGASRARFEPRNYGNVDRVRLSRTIPVCAPPLTRRSAIVRISSNPLTRGPRRALFVHIAFSVIPRRAMPRNVMSRHMTRLGAVVEGRA